MAISLKQLLYWTYVSHICVEHAFIMYYNNESKAFEDRRTPSTPPPFRKFCWVFIDLDLLEYYRAGTAPSGAEIPGSTADD